MKAYITGGTGFVGSNVVRVFRERYDADVFVPVHSWRPDTDPGYRYGPLDLCDADAVRESVLAEQPDVIVHCAILNDIDAMFADRQRAWESYVGSTRSITAAGKEVGAKTVLVSTDWVFDGTQAPAAEDAPPNPINLYGVLKMASELVALEVDDRAAVARVSGVNGVHWARPDSPREQDRGFGYFLSTVVDALGAGGRFTVWEGDVNQVATPSLASECAFMIGRIAELDRAGIFHCCGGESADRVTLAHRTADTFGLDRAMIDTGPPVDDPTHPEPSPFDTSLDATATAAALDYELPDLERQLTEFRAQLETGQITYLGATS